MALSKQTSHREGERERAKNLDPAQANIDDEEEEEAKSHDSTSSQLAT